jgi:hypothetical protein
LAYRITLENSVGVLDVRECGTEEETRAAVLDIVAGMDHFCHGDVVRVTETEEEAALSTGIQKPTIVKT